MISKGGKKYPLPGTLESNRVHNFFSCVAEFIPLLLVSDILGGMYNLAMNKGMQRKKGGKYKNTHRCLATYARNGDAG